MSGDKPSLMPLFRKRTTPDVLEPGAEVAGYRVEGVLGHGRMGVVYLAEHKHLARPVALKVLARGLDREFRERFVRESRIAASLSHRHIVAVYDAGEADGVLWIAMQLVRGTDLRTVLRRAGPLAPSEVGQIAAQTASALDEAHGVGLVHRDVKPANILLQKGHAYLSDFGLTRRMASHTDLPVDMRLDGAADYIAPEQIHGDPTDGRVDQYALACVVHHALTGAPPFADVPDMEVLEAHVSDVPPRPTEFRDDLPAAVDAVLARALAKRPDQRYPSAGDFAEALRAGLGVADPRLSEGYVLVGVKDPSTRSVIRAALEPGRAEVAEAGDAATLLSHAGVTAPGLVLLDVSLPGGSVSDVVLELRRGAGERIPVVAVAERGRDEQWRAALAAGADDVLMRPFSAFQLLAKVRDHMPAALGH